jgi:hypothetical protein
MKIASTKYIIEPDTEDAHVMHTPFPVLRVDCCEVGGRVLLRVRKNLEGVGVKKLLDVEYRSVGPWEMFRRIDPPAGHYLP